MIYLLLVQVQAACPTFSCPTSSIKLSPGVCSNYSSNSYYLRPCQDPMKKECLFHPQAISYCSNTKHDLSFPGEKCRSDSDCFYPFGCKSKVCEGVPENSRCADTHQCAPGLYCSSYNKCIPQIKVNENSCQTDFECTNNAVCDGGTCRLYASVKNGEEVKDCLDGKSYACESHTCKKIDEKFKCIINRGKNRKNPIICKESSDCYSHSDFGIIDGECTCGHSSKGSSYCDIGTGDQEYLEFIENSRAWHNSTAIKKCNSIRRRTDKCIIDWFSYSARVKLFYYTLLVFNYPKLQDLDQCTLSTLHSVYSVISKQFKSLSK